MKQKILKFLPLLILYFCLVFLFSSTTSEGDEGNYINYAGRIANSISQVHQSDFNGPTLWWGPGYPLILTPFVLLNLPLLLAKYLNALFLFGAIIYFYNTLILYINDKYATIISYILGLYPPLSREIHLLITESMVFFIVCGFIFHYCRYHKKTRHLWVHLSVASVYLSCLALTKIFFGYVILAGLLMILVLFIWQHTDNAKKTVFMYLFALILSIPYLIYTYSLTGKYYYWGTSGGMSLYWMTTSYNQNELGSWFSVKDVQEFPELAQHREFFNKIAYFTESEMDDAFKKQAIENITHNPFTYFKNWVSNIGRLIFSYPFSYTSQKISTYFYIIPNMFLIVLFILSVYPAILRLRSIPFEVLNLLLFMLISFGGTSLVSAYDRQFRPLVPFMLLWLTFVFLRILKIEFRPDTAESDH